MRSRKCYGERLIADAFAQEDFVARAWLERHWRLAVKKQESAVYLVQGLPVFAPRPVQRRRASKT